jgi:hypothetical protein
MRGHPPPELFDEARWHQFRLDALALLHPQRGHAETLLAAGWDTLSLFGLHPTRPYRRVSHMGLAACLRGAEVLEIAPDAIRLRHGTGSLARFYRTPSQPGAVPAWSFHDDHHDQPQESPMAYEENVALDPDAYQSEAMAFLGYHVKGLHPPGQDATPGGSFTRRVGRDRLITDLSQGTIFDFATSRIGWMLTTGVPGEAPLRVWSPTRAKQIPKPDDRDWRTAFWAQLALQVEGEVIRLVWETSQGTSWKAYRELMLMLAGDGPKRLPQLPLVAHTGHTPTMMPTFRIISFEDRPACLPTDPEKLERSEGRESRQSQRGGNGTGGYVSRPPQRPGWDTPSDDRPSDDSWGDEPIPF